MSDTPRTDELAKRDFVPDGLWIRHARELERENAALRNEIARLNGQTRWQCACGGTDCEGQKENEHLRRSLEVTRQISCARIVEAEKLDIMRGCLEDILKLTDIHEAHLFAQQALRDIKPCDT